MSIDPRQDPHGALDELVAEIEKTYELLGQEVAALRERAAHAAIDEIPDDLSQMRGRWSQLLDVLHSLQGERREP